MTWKQMKLKKIKNVILTRRKKRLSAASLVHGRLLLTLKLSVEV